MVVPLLVLAIVALVVFLVRGSGPGAPAPPRTATSPVDLSTPVDMAAGVAHPSAVVRSGDARIEVLGPTLLRLEYSPSGTFENSPTVNALDRRMPVPHYTSRVSGGWLTVQTSAATFRYEVRSGPFSATNTSLRFSVGSRTSTVRPTWEWECPFDQTCQAGAASLAGGAELSQTQAGYRSSAGYVGYLDDQGARATWTVLGAPAGPAVLAIRYSNLSTPPFSPAVGKIGVVVDGRPLATVPAPPTDTTDPWSTLTTTATLKAGTNSVEVASDSGQHGKLSLHTLSDNFNLGIDTLSIGPAGAPAPAPAATDPLGGWIRGFDTYTYGPGETCASGAGATCQSPIEPLHTNGLLDGAGWRLLDDTQSAVWTPGGWVRPRNPGGDVEDGYLFVYGHDYTGALRTFDELTGSAPLLPRSLFGVWYSDYTPYSSATVEDSIYPAFAKSQVPLNTLSLDTDWKAPDNWNGWEWNTGLFPDPAAFLAWARSHHIDVTLNIHSSIDDNDPELPTAERIAGNTLAASSCSAGPCRVWDWSTVKQAESNFDLQQSFQRQGVSFWWLDWCCDASVVTMPGLTPDSWIDHLYAQEMVDQGQRGFVLARIGASNGDPDGVYPAGAWSAHTTGIAFTGDAWGTWNTLAAEVALTPDEATIGEPYVSDDIGSFLGPPPTQAGADPPDLYDRWVQFGTFQPVLRLHSNNEDRLPWQYPQPVQGITEKFLRLREALIPYTYTLAAQAHDTGLPITQPLYLDDPGTAAAYANPDEYLYGSDMLVAPVTVPGSTAETEVWFPPGRWIDFFTGATFTGPLTTMVATPLDRMPVFVRAGGIIPEQSPSATPSEAAAHPVIKVYSGSRGTFSLYDDSGTGLGYTRGQYTETPIAASVGTGGRAGTVAPSSVAVGAVRGHYPGAPTSIGYEIEMIDLTRPTRVVMSGQLLRERTVGSGAAGWYYLPGSATVVVNTPAIPTSRPITVVATGGRSIEWAEPSAASS
ncbi:MAG: TIM-barrel domain-containing protein [Acidimicrobiales bacterium]